MNTISRKTVTVSSLLLAVALSACGSSAPEDDRPIGDIPEPAVAYCTSHGGTIDLRREPAGEYVVCKFYGGSECDSWAYFRGECKPGDCTTWETCKRGADSGVAETDTGAPVNGCEGCMPNPASVNCVEKGGSLQLRSEPAGEYGVCKFSDGSECDEWAFFRGECKPGDCVTWESCKPTANDGAGSSV